MDNKKLYIKTFGCQMNEHDTAKMIAILADEGYSSVSSAGEADLILFNTCTIREKPHHKAISEVGRALKLKERRPNLIVGITGCVAQEEGTNLFEKFKTLDLVLGPDQLYRLPEAIREIQQENSSKISATDLINEYEKYNFLKNNSLHASRFTSYVTIVKGCNNFCTFCIVPYVRGREISKSPDDIIKEIQNLCKNGVQEVTLLGQNVNSYGKDNDAFCTFPELLHQILKETDIRRIRYTSPHPKDLSKELIKEHRDNKSLCEHMHLPVQAGANSVLKRMNRRYTREHFIGLIKKLRNEVPEIAITTDLIVGFSGETDEDFQETLNLMEEVEFDGMYAFKYSSRPGTKAAEEFEDDVAEEIKSERLQNVLKLNEKIVLKKHEKYVGTMQEVLVEGESKRGNQVFGRTRTNIIVNFEADESNIGKLLNVKILSAGLNSLKGEL